MKTSKLLLAATLLWITSLPALAQVNDTYVIPVTANARGAFGTHWMTRFSIFNPHLDYPLVVRVAFLPSGGATGPMESIELPPNALAYSDNLLEDLYGITSGSGSLLVATFPEDNPGVPDSVLARGFLVTSDTFNNTPNGTFGQTIPGVWTGLLDYEYGDYGITSIAHGIRNAGVWRTNVGAVNLGRCTAIVYVTAYDADGNTIRADMPLNVPPFGHIQDRLPVAVDNGTVEFSVYDPCAEDDDRYAVVFPYTSTIDQRTGDPTYQQPTLLANPSAVYAKGKTIDPLALGKKIDSAYAKRVMANAEDRGRAYLKKTKEGWQIQNQ